MEEEATGERTRRAGALALCLLLSLVLHVLLGLLLLLTAEKSPKQPAHQQSKGQRAVLVSRAPADKKEKTEPEKDEQEEPEAPKPFAKTDADRKQQRPNRADFEGQRDARAEGMNNTARQDDTPVPTMEGEEKDETNTLHQERQDGDVEHYGKNDNQPAPQPEPQQEGPPTPPSQDPTPGLPDAPPVPEPDTGTAAQPTEQEATEAQQKDTPAEDGDLKLKHPEEEDEPREPQPEPPVPPQGLPDSKGTAPVTTPQPPRVRDRRPVYDPTQADHAQPPGLRTRERRSRSTGQFIIGKLPSCNVEATPRGQYEELVYRLIARQWYFACDQHRGDIIPGTIIIALRITTRGRVESMNLVNRRGASVSQQSFTFAAIRRAQFPAMPKEVAKTLIGNCMELIITFDFN